MRRRHDQRPARYYRRVVVDRLAAWVVDGVDDGRVVCMVVVVAVVVVRVASGRTGRQAGGQMWRPRGRGGGYTK